MVEICSNENSICIEFEREHIRAFFVFLLHAKFGLGPEYKIYSHDLLNELFRGMMQIDDLFKERDFVLSSDMESELEANPSFDIIINFLKNTMSLEGNELRSRFLECIYPYRFETAI